MSIASDSTDELDQTPDPSRDFASLLDRPGHQIRRLHQIHVALFLEECSEYNLTPVQYAVLTVLNDHDILDQNSTAGEAGIDRNTTADVVRRLIARGLVERVEGGEDKRSRYSRITQKGRELVAEVRPAMIRAQQRFIEPLTDQEYELVMRLLMKWTETSNEASRAPVRPLKARKRRTE